MIMHDLFPDPKLSMYIQPFSWNSGIIVMEFSGGFVKWPQNNLKGQIMTLVFSGFLEE
jgi:hypothetical protein